jgi:hypothetical protein
MFMHDPLAHNAKGNLRRQLNLTKRRMLSAVRLTQLLEAFWFFYSFYFVHHLANICETSPALWIC